MEMTSHEAKLQFTLTHAHRVALTCRVVLIASKSRMPLGIGMGSDAMLSSGGRDA